VQQPLIVRSASSTDIEPVFSRGRDLQDYCHNRLSAESMQALLCLGDWICQGVVTMTDITGSLATANSDDSLDSGDDKDM